MGGLRGFVLRWDVCGVDFVVCEHGKGDERTEYEIVTSSGSEEGNRLIDTLHSGINCYSDEARYENVANGKKIHMLQ